MFGRTLLSVTRQQSRVIARAAQGQRTLFGFGKKAAAPAKPAAAAASATPATAAAGGKPDMFCRQCEQTKDQVGCKVVGVCGKTPEVAALQDLLVFQIQGIGQYAHAARSLDAKYVNQEVDRFVLVSMFSTLTNVNFDAEALSKYVKDAERMRDAARTTYLNACKEKGVKPTTFDASTPADFKLPAGAAMADLIAAGRNVGLEVRKAKLGEDLAGLAEMVIYGLKGVCAYTEHALMLGGEDSKIYGNIHECLAKVSDPALDVGKVLALVDLVGATNLRAMEILDHSGTGRYGHPVPTSVSTTPKPGKCILVSGHDLVDLENILKECEGTGINVYTHGELLPANAYPGLKKYSSLAGHYGGPWQLQKFEFAQFPGAIVMTTNCMIEPMKSYKNRIFTRSAVGWPGVPHIEQGQGYASVIAKAKECDGFDAADIKKSKPLMTGFARNAVMGVADKVIGAIQSGAIKHFFVIGGCDGSEGERSYFTDLAKSTPKDSVILGLGCGKYRYNREELGDIGGIPRMLDLGQCNDAYSGIQIAVALAGALKTDVNSLPLSFAVSWFEQKAVAVLLTLLHLNIQNIRLGTHLPAFITPNVLKVLIDKYQIKQANHRDVAADLKAMLANK